MARICQCSVKNDKPQIVPAGERREFAAEKFRASVPCNREINPACQAQDQSGLAGLAHGQTPRFCNCRVALPAQFEFDSGQAGLG